MSLIKFLKVGLLTISMIFPIKIGWSCSMYKVTINGTTIVGCNEDAWRLTSRIWFENAVKPGSFGVAFTGSRFDGINGFAPQSGMNEYGLTFSRLASYTPANQPAVSAHKQKITNPTFYLKDILHSCKTIEEVKNYISQYDHSYFLEDVFIYVERSGKYLIVEPFTLLEGDEPKYILSNFCPSVTTEEDANKLTRYHNGVEFVKNNIDTTIKFCTALSDTMHVCRKRNGDGTLLTSIWNLNSGTTTLYFYHNYKQAVVFNIKDELAKGDHILEVPKLFSPNREYEKLGNFKIPDNSLIIKMYFLFCSGLFLFSALYFITTFFTRRNLTRFSNFKIVLFSLCTMMLYYLYVLATNINIFYFPAPYKEYKSPLLNIAAYIPFLFLLLIIPLIIANKKIFKEFAWGFFAKWLFAINNLVFASLVLLFFYWGLYNVIQ